MKPNKIIITDLVKRSLEEPYDFRMQRALINRGLYDGD